MVVEKMPKFFSQKNKKTVHHKKFGAFFKADHYGLNRFFTFFLLILKSKFQKWTKKVCPIFKNAFENKKKIQSLSFIFKKFFIILLFLNLKNPTKN